MKLSKKNILRQEAEKRVASHRLDTKNLTDEEIKSLIHELEVHQIELEMQNDELNHAHKELIVEQQRYMDLYNYAPIGYLNVDSEHVIQKANATISQLLGMGTEQIVGNSINRFILNEDMDIFYVFHRKVLNKKSIEHIELRMLNNSNQEFHARLMAKSDVDQEIRIAVSDITDLITAREQADESSKLKTEFLHNMSHEIRTPLNAIMGFSALLQKSNPDPDKLNNFAEIIRKNGNQLLSIINGVLAISSLNTQKETVTNEQVDINNLLEALQLIFLQQAKDKDIELNLTCNLDKQQAMVYTDETKLTQILSNLLHNALKFTKKGSVTVGCDLQKDKLIFVIKDTGIGIAPQEQKHVFERFRQANKSISTNYGGTGLGLSISKEFAILMGGDIYLKSEPGKGSTFQLEMPYIPVNHSNESDIDQKPETNKSLVILIADDEIYNFELLKEYLFDYNAKLLRAKDGQEAVDLVSSNQALDLVLMDIKMPRMDGYQAAVLIKQMRPNLPIIAQSAYALEHEIKKYNMAFDDYITKPIEEEVLKQKITEMTRK